MQLHSIRIDTIFAHYIGMSALLEDLLPTRRAKRLYNYLLITYLQTSKKEFKLNYPELVKKLGYKPDNIRKSFVEIESANLAYRGDIEGTHDFFVTMDLEIFERNFKSIL